MNVLEMKCLPSLVGLLRIDTVRNGEEHRKVGIERDLAGRVDQRQLQIVWTRGENA